jgi:general secretion pathway protein K
MRERSEEGIALIAVLWMLTLLSIVAAALSLETRSSTRIARNMAENAVVRAAADAGIQRAILDLVTSTGAPTDARKFLADGTVYNWQFVNSKVQVSIQDEVKIDLNEAPEELLAALFDSVGINTDTAKSLAAAIADFRDPDNLPRPGGAELAEYRAAGLAWGPKNAPFQMFEELQQVLGMTPEIYERVASYLTIYSVARVNDPTLVGERLTEILRNTSINSAFLGTPAYYSKFLGTPAYSIRAQAHDSKGGVFVREAVVQLIPGLRPPTIIPWVLLWREGSVTK